MSASENSFVQALRDHPEEDAQLLVFADWLDDNSDPRAELLRVQCELSRWVPERDRRHALQQQEQTLLYRLDAAWMGALVPYCLSWERRRGLATMTMQTRRFVGKRFTAQAADWFARAWVSGLRLRGAGVSLTGALLLGEPLTELITLDLSGNRATGLTMQALVDSPHLGQLRHLVLTGCDLDDADARMLADSTLLQQLETLDIRNNRLTDRGFRPLLRAADPNHLHWLAVQGNDLSWSVLAELCQWRQRPPDTSEYRPLTNSLGMEFVKVPSGSFLLGSPGSEKDRYADEGPRHLVTLTNLYYLGVYPVTQWQFERVMGTTPSRFGPGDRGGLHHPVEQVTSLMAEEFCRRLSEMPTEQGLGYRYRLPTEAEWEHACRAGTETPFFFGATLSSLQANYDGGYPYVDGKRGPYRSCTSPVGSYPANGFGLYDMHGNVWEWCSDWYEEEYYQDSPAIDPTGPTAGIRRVLRGGGWYNNAGSCRSAYRYYGLPEESDNDLGFRVVLFR